MPPLVAIAAIVVLIALTGFLIVRWAARTEKDESVTDFSPRDSKYAKAIHKRAVNARKDALARAKREHKKAQTELQEAEKLQDEQT
jgi:FtsZ-interacting cell division protein ZipA